MRTSTLYSAGEPPPTPSFVRRGLSISRRRVERSPSLPREYREERSPLLTKRVPPCKAPSLRRRGLGEVRFPGQPAEHVQITGENKVEEDRYAAGRPEAALRVSAPADKIPNDHHPRIDNAGDEEKTPQPRTPRGEETSPGRH